MKLVTVFVGLFILAIPVFAQSESCAGVHTYEIVACLGKSLEAVNAKLNTEYQKALKVAKDQYTSADVQNLKDAERKWVAYRDAICKAEYGLVKGTAGQLIHISCLIRITKQRISDIEADY